MLLSLWLPAWAGWGPWDLIRVDEPGPTPWRAPHGAPCWSSLPRVAPWRVEPQAELDISYQVWEAREALEVQPWHDAGFLGQGVRVAVMDYQWQGAEGALASLGEVETHDCWAHDACTPGIDLLQPTYSSEDNVHGVACAEVIRALAPEAELHLLRVNNLTTFENAAEWAIREGIDLVSMSMSFYSNSFYDGSGPVNAAAERMSEAGVLLVTSAGNSAEKHWMESWRDEDHDRLHEFPSGSEYLPIYFQQGQRRVLLEWDQYANCGDTDLGARVYSEDGRVVGRSDKLQSTEESSCDPQERIQVQADEDGWYYLQLERVAGDPSTRFFVSGGEALRAHASWLHCGSWHPP